MTETEDEISATTFIVKHTVSAVQINDSTVTREQTFSMTVTYEDKCETDATIVSLLDYGLEIL